MALQILGTTDSSGVVTGATTTNSPPTTATQGFALRKGHGSNRIDQGFDDDLEEAVFVLKSTAGSGVMNVTIRMWAYSSVSGTWHPLGVGGDTTKGTINGGAAIGETTADLLTHTELIQGLRHFDRIYAEITAINGTSTAVAAWLQASGG